MTMECGCCETGVEYVARHVDQGGFMPAHLDSKVLAQAYIGTFDTNCLPPHLPDVCSLSAWIGEYGQSRRRSLWQAA